MSEESNQKNSDEKSDEIPSLDVLTDPARSMPSSDDAEKGIMSCLLQSPSTLLPDARKEIPEDAFYHPSHRLLYKELLTFNVTDRVLDIVTLSQHLIDKGLMDKVGGPSFIAELLSFIPTPAHYPHYKGILRDKMNSRRVICSAAEMINAVQSNQADLRVAKPTISEHVHIIRSCMAPKEDGPSWKDNVDQWLDDWDSRARGEKSSFMSVQWERWNNDIGGLPSGYHILSGRTSSGKSTLLGNLLKHASIDLGRPSLFASYEMPVWVVISRIVADIADVDGCHLFAPERSHPDKAIVGRIADAAARIKRSDLRVIHYPAMRASQLCQIAEEMHRKHGDLVFGVDYIQLVPEERGLPKGSTRERAVANISEQLRCLAKSLDIPVIALSQLNNDLSTRESSSVNMDSDIHIRVDRWKEPKSDTVIDKGLWVDKNRNGRANFRMPIKLNCPRFRFEDVSFMMGTGTDRPNA